MRRIVTRLLAVILLATLMMQGLPVTASAAGETGGVTLKNTDSGELLPFEVENMFPGDQITREYVVTTVHDKPIALNFRADVRAGYETLAEVLKIRVEIPGKTVELYDGLMRDMPTAVTVDLAADEKQTTYQITVYLETSVGNKYQLKELVADFRWWYLDQEACPVTITAEKTMDKNYARGSQFSFQLKDDKGNVIETVKNKDGHIEFSTLEYILPGTHTYTISEVKGSNSKVEYDSAVYKATVTVSDEGKATITYTRNGKAYEGIPRFTNVTKGQSMPSHPSDVEPENPKSGDQFPLGILIAIMVSSGVLLICLILLWKGRKKEDDA